MSGQECACQRDLWDVRVAWTGTLAGGSHCSLERAGDRFPPYSPVIVQNPERAHWGLGWKEFSGIPRTGRVKKMYPEEAQITTFSLPTPTSSSKGARGKAEGRPSLAAGKPDLSSFPSPNPSVTDTAYFVTFRKQS